MTKNILFFKCMLYICILSFQDWKCTNIESSDYSASSSSDQPHFQSQSTTFPQVMTNKNLPSNVVCECQTILDSLDEGFEFQFKHNDFMSSTTVFGGVGAIKPSWVFCNYGDMKTLSGIVSVVKYLAAKCLHVNNPEQGCWLRSVCQQKEFHRLYFSFQH